MRFSKYNLNDATKAYLDRRVTDYENGKLSYNEEQQLFQDLQDSGYIVQLPQYTAFMTRLIKTGLVSIVGAKVTH